MMEKFRETDRHQINADGCLTFGPSDDVRVAVAAESAIVVMVHSPKSGTTVCRYQSPRDLAKDREQYLLPADFAGLIALIDRGIESGKLDPAHTKIFVGGGSYRRTLSADYQNKVNEDFRYAAGTLRKTGLPLEENQLKPDSDGHYVFQTGPGTHVFVAEEI